MKTTTIKIFTFLLLALAINSVQINAQNIYTIAGTGIGGTSGDGGLATNALLYGPESVVIDAAGNVYLTDKNRIRKVSVSTGIITTIAGTVFAGFGGDGGLATAAALDDVNGVAVDKYGNVFIADSDNLRIRKVSAGTGIITTFAGTGVYGDSGDGGLATAAQFKDPRKVAVDTFGNVYVSDAGSFRIRKINAATGIITTYVGDGWFTYAGDGGPATAASIHASSGAIFIDKKNILYIVDSFNERIRKVDPATGIITTIAGNGTSGYWGDGGLATAAQFDLSFAGVGADAQGNVYVSDWGNFRIRKIAASTGIVTTIAGTGIAGYTGDGGPAIAAQINGPHNIAFDPYGNICFGSGNVIRKITLSNTAINDNYTSSSFHIYPNPSAGYFTITLSENEYQLFKDQTFYIINELGQTLQQVKLNSENSYTMNIKNLCNAIYFIVGYNNDQIIREKIIVTK